MSRAKAQVKILDPFEQRDLEEKQVFAMYGQGLTRTEIAERSGFPLARVREIVNRKTAEARRRYSGPIPRMNAALRLERIAEKASDRAEGEHVAAADSARLYATAIAAQQELSRLLGLNAPVRTSVQTTAEVTLVRRDEQLRFLRDPAYRELQASLEEHVIDVHYAEGPDARGLRPHRLEGRVDDQAASGPDEPPDDGAGGA